MIEGWRLGARLDTSVHDHVFFCGRPRANASASAR